jgi:hypothetical protein
MWECAIANPTTAERAVRRVCDATGVRAVSAYTPLSPIEVQRLGLQTGEVRKREISPQSAEPSQ